MKKSAIILVTLIAISNTVIAQDQFTNNGNLELHSGVSIAYQGDFVNNGSFIPGTSTVKFNGSSTQDISGTSSTSFYDLAIDNASGVNLNRAIAIDNDLTITSGTFNVNSGNYQINLGGDFINNSNFNGQNGKIVFDGAITQQVLGSSTTTFNDIDLTNTAVTGLQLESNVNLQGILALSDNTSLDADGGSGSGVFTLKSNATDDARIAALGLGASVTGNLTFEKYFAGAGMKYWRYISSAVKDATVADLQAQIPISGSFTGSDNGTNGIPAGAYASLYYYDNGVSGSTLDDRWVNYPTSTNSELISSDGYEARGYALWMRETGATNYNLTGTVNQGTIDFNPTGNNEGWNLLGNPYPSDINWDAAGWTKTDIEGNTIYIWNGTQYLEWNGSVGSLGNGRIAKGQSFWIKSISTSVDLIATEAVKSTTQATTYRTSGNTDPSYIDLTVSAGGYTDHTYIQFIDTTKFEFDIADASKLSNDIFNLATLSRDSVVLAINVIPGNEEAFEIPISLTNTWDAVYTYGWQLTDDLSSKYTISIEDKYTHKSYEVSNTSSGFDFDIFKDEASKDWSRFVLHFEALYSPPDVTLDIIADNTLCGSDNLLITIEKSELGVSYYAQRETNVVSETVIGTGDDIQLLVLNDHLILGANSIQVYVSNDDLHEVLPLNQVLVINKYRVSEVVYPESEGVCNAGTSIINAYGAVGYEKYYWYASMDEDVSMAVEPYGVFKTRLISESTTYYVEIRNQVGCKSRRIPIEVQVTHLEEPIISVDTVSNDSYVFYSNHLDNNQWYCNNLKMDEQNSQFIIASEPGFYNVEVSYGACVLVSDTVELPDLVLGIGGNGEKNTIPKIYPNPVNDYFTVQFNGLINEFTVSIRNLNGTELLTKRYSNSSSVQMNVAELNQGIYVVVITTDRAIYSSRMIKN